MQLNVNAAECPGAPPSNARDAITDANVRTCRMTRPVNMARAVFLASSLAVAAGSASIPVLAAEESPAQFSCKFEIGNTWTFEAGKFQSRRSFRHEKSKFTEAQIASFCGRPGRKRRFPRSAGGRASPPSSYRSDKCPHHLEAV